MSTKVDPIAAALELLEDKFGYSEDAVGALESSLGQPTLVPPGLKMGLELDNKKTYSATLPPRLWIEIQRGGKSAKQVDRILFRLIEELNNAANDAADSMDKLLNDATAHPKVGAPLGGCDFTDDAGKMVCRDGVTSADCDIYLHGTWHAAPCTGFGKDNDHDKDRSKAKRSRSGTHP